MLLYNLYHLAADEGLITDKKIKEQPFKNYMDRYLYGTVTDDNPKGTKEYDYVDFITSRQLIENNKELVTYRAGDHITLLPNLKDKPMEPKYANNFWAKKGSLFHAYIDHVTGCNTQIPNQNLIKKLDASRNIPVGPIDTIPCVQDNYGNTYDTIIIVAPFADTTVTIQNGSSSGQDTSIFFGPYTYLWDLGNGEKAYTRNAKLYCPNSGFYHVQLVITYARDYNFTINYNIYKEECSLIKPIENKKIQFEQSKQKFYISIFPNPNNGDMKVNYSIPDQETGELKIYNLLGENLINYNLSGYNNNFYINGTFLDRGIYFYKATYGNKSFRTGKIVVIK
jgi:hypothetical protein